MADLTINEHRVEYSSFDITPAWKKSRTCIMFIHGIGYGAIPYISFINKIQKHGYGIIIMEFPGISGFVLDFPGIFTEIHKIFLIFI